MTVRDLELKGNQFRFENEVFMRRAEAIDSDVAVTVVADRGFGDVDRYQSIWELNLHYVIRFRGNINVVASDGEMRTAHARTGANGKGVVMVPRDLTDATRARAVGATKKLDSRNTKGEKDNKKRMALVAAVYTIAPQVRTPEQVVAGLRHVRDSARIKPPRPEHKRVWSTLERTVEEVASDLFDEADLRDPNKTKTCYALVDGETGLERHIAAEAARRGRKVTVVLDFIHAVECLWKASTAFHAEDAPEREQWVLERLTKVLHGHVSEVAAGMAHSATLRGLTSAQRKPVDKAVKYLTKRKSMMPYGELLAAGTPIASGVIEGACRHLICDRLERAGARWTLDRAEAVMQLRALVANGDFEPYWQYHQDCERQRNHDLRYAGAKAPDVRNAMPGRHLRAVQ